MERDSTSIIQSEAAYTTYQQEHSAHWDAAAVWMNSSNVSDAALERSHLGACPSEKYDQLSILFDGFLQLIIEEMIVESVTGTER